MGCYGGKYIHAINSTNLYDLPCQQKSQIAYIWEVDYFKDIGDHESLYGCLNLHCRPVFGAWMYGKLGYLNIISWTLLFVLICCIIFATTLLSKFSNSQDNDVLYHSRDSEVTFGIITALTIIGTGILALWALPATPLVFPYTESNLLSDKDSIASSVATEIDPNLLVPDHKWFPVQDV